MNCPRCASTPMQEFERDGIRVDACPQCRGLWLDKGELEQLIARSRKHDDDERGHGSHDRDHDHGDDHDRDHDRHGHSHHDRDHDHDHDQHRHGHSHHDGQKRLKSRRWLESLGDLFG